MSVVYQVPEMHPQYGEYSQNPNYVLAVEGQLDQVIPEHQWKLKDLEKRKQAYKESVIAAKEIEEQRQGRLPAAVWIPQKTPVISSGKRVLSSMSPQEEAFLVSEPYYTTTNKREK